MGELLTREKVETLLTRDLAYDQIEGAIRSVCASHELLRARLESVKAALFDARIIVAAEIARATGSRGGWTVSPVQLAEAVAAALAAAGEKENANG